MALWLLSILLHIMMRRQSLKLLSEFLLEPPSSHIMKRYILEVRYLKVLMTLLKDSSKNIQIAAFHIFKVLESSSPSLFL
uniref:Uncharacterized protein n=1 Tax=Salix viminalis TaxID=40686 RepID=A0A6N2KRI3_SALVM